MERTKLQSEPEISIQKLRTFIIYFDLMHYANVCQFSLFIRPVLTNRLQLSSKS